MKKISNKGLNAIMLGIFVALLFAVVALQMHLFHIEPKVEYTAQNGYGDTLHVVTAADYKPYSFYDEHQQPSGHDVEMIAMLADRLHMTLDLQLLSWDECLAAIASGAADVVMTLDYSDSFAGTDSLLKSDPISFDEFIVFAKHRINSIGDLYGKRIAVMENGNVLAQAQMLNLMDQCVLYDDNRRALHAVADGEADCALMRHSVGTTLLTERNARDARKVKGYISIGKSYMCLGIAPAESALAARINAALDEMKADGNMTRLHDKWVKPFVLPISFKEFVMKNLWLLFVLFVFAEVMVAQYMQYRSRKKHRESERYTYRKVVENLSNDFDCVALITPGGDAGMGTATLLRTSERLRRNLTVPDGETDFSHCLENVRGNLVAPEDRSHFEAVTSREVIMEKLAKGASYYVNFRALIDGERCHYQMKFSPVLDREQEMTGIVCGLCSVEETVQREVQEKRQLQERVQLMSVLSSEYLALYFMNVDNHTYSVFSFDHEVLADTNVLLQQYTDGFTLLRAFGHSAAVHPDDRALFDAMSPAGFRNRLAHSKKFTIRFRRDYGNGFRWSEMDVVKCEGVDEPLHSVAIGFAERDAEISRELQQQEQYLMSTAEAEKSNKLIESYIHTYRTVLIVRLDDASFQTVKGSEGHIEVKRSSTDFHMLSKMYVERFVYEYDRALMEHEQSFDVIREHLAQSPTYGIKFRRVVDGTPLWYEMVVSSINDDEIAVGFRDRDQETLLSQVSTTILENYKGIYVLDLDTDMARAVRNYSDFVDEVALTHTYSEVLKGLAQRVSGADRAYFERVADCAYLRQLLARDGKSVYLCPVPGQGIDGEWVKFELHVIGRHNGVPQTVMVGIAPVDAHQKERMMLSRQLAEKEMLLSHFVKAYASAYSVNLLEDSFEILHMQHMLSSVFRMDGCHDDMFPFIEKHIHPDDRDLMRQMIDKDYVHSRLRTENEITFTVRELLDEQVRTMRGIIMKGVDEDHVAVGFLDVTEEVEREHMRQEQLQQALDMAESASRSKSSFLLNMSHDIRTPMNAITGFTMMAKKNQDNPEMVNDCLDKITVAGENMLELINKVLDMSRIESGKIVLENKPYDVIDHTEAIVIIMRANAEMKGIRLESLMNNIRDRRVLADGGRMNQIMLNIIGNAVKYTPEGGLVTCTTRQVDCDRAGYATYTFTVQDTGIGMSEEYLQRIYEPFSREKTSTENKIEGTGLGMSIVQHLVGLMGGTIDIQSALGVGTTITVTLTLQKQETGTAASADEHAVENPSLSIVGRRVLLVEDNELNQEIAKYILEEKGLVVDVVDDGDVAVQRISDIAARGDYGYYDYVLMDIQMPRMNGYDATRAIRQITLPEGQHIPIIAMTANAFAEDRRNAFEAGMDDHLAKPIDVDQLLNVLTRYL